MTDADKIRARIKWLHEMGDAACPYQCWRDTDEHLLQTYQWVLDLDDSRIDWPSDCK